jgi:pyruvate/2-oxoglutarate dehydrogenase complex dihydrolipoamide dehydrogenase (E3) component
MRRPLTPDLCVIGAGAGGLAVAAGAAQMGASVVLVERDRMGGDCLNFGCVPSKSLLWTGRIAALWRRGGELGIAYAPPRVDFPAVADSIARVVARLAPNDSAERFTGLGVTVLKAEARFVDRRTVLAGAVEIRPRRCVVATGSEPVIPPIPGLAALPHFTNETIFANRVLPRHLIVIGGGPIGVELAQAHRRLGAEVTILDIGPILPREDPELAALLAARLAAEGVGLRPRVTIDAVARDGEALAVTLAGGERICGSHLLVAAGRRPAVAALDLAAAGIAATAEGIMVDRRLRTTNRRVFAIGDVAGGPQFTHRALHHAGVVIKNALFHIPARARERGLPRVVYTDPELAQVGLDERAARAAGAVRVLRWSFAESDRAHTERDTEGLVKIVTTKRGHILGAAILGAEAGELILPWALAIARHLPLRALADLIVPYPTRGEASKRAAASFYTPALFSARTRRLVRLLARLGS